MPQKFFVLLNHELTQGQVVDIEKYGAQLCYFPPELSQRWQQLLLNQSIAELCAPFVEFLQANSQAWDYIFIQGEAGCTFYLVDYCLQKKLIPLHALTERVATEKKLSDGRIQKQFVFEHRGFRNYTLFKE